MARNTNRPALMTAMIVVALLLLTVGVWLGWRTVSGPRNDTAADRADSGDALGATIRVGVIMSRRTADADNNGRGPVGWEREYRILRELLDPQFDIHPIVDPGTTNDEHVLNVCRANFGTRTIDGGDLDALATLDVIVASHVTNLEPKLLDALERAIAERGVGFLMRMFLGQYEPGLTRQVRALIGFAADGPIRYVSSPGVECEVVGDHPLLGNLSGTKKRFMMAPNGFAGPYAGTPLIQVADRAAADPKAPEGAATAAMLYVADLGKGKIVGCPFAGARPTPMELERSGPGTFSSRAVRWLAEQKRRATHDPPPK